MTGVLAAAGPGTGCCDEDAEGVWDGGGLGAREPGGVEALLSVAHELDRAGEFRPDDEASEPDVVGSEEGGDGEWLAPGGLVGRAPIASVLPRAPPLRYVLWRRLDIVPALARLCFVK